MLELLGCTLTRNVSWRSVFTDIRRTGEYQGWSMALFGATAVEFAVELVS
jgi:hypothetical protein